MFARAPFEADGWDAALRALASATGSSRAQLIALGEGNAVFNWLTDPDAAVDEEFIAIEAYRSDVSYRMAACRGPLEVTWEQHYDAVRAVSSNEAYLEHVRRWDAEHGAQMVLSSSPRAFFGLATLHGENDGRTTEAQRQVLQDAGLQILASIRTQRAIEHRGVDLLRGSLDSIRSAAILLDGTGRVCAVTGAAEALLGYDTLQVRDGILHAARINIDTVLQNAVGSILAGGTQPIEFWLRSLQGPMLVEVCPLPRQNWYLGFAPRIIIMLKNPLLLAGDHATRLSDALDLTSAEGEIVALLAQGHSRQDIANMRGVSAHTVAAQLRSIFMKCDVNREVELVSLARTIIEMALR